VVTGSNKGIGLAIVKSLCSKFDGDVYLTARDEARGHAAVDELKKSGLNPKFHQLDVDNVASIRTLRDHLKNTYGGLDVLVHNAGMAFSTKSTEPFGKQAELTIRTNFTGTQNLSHELFPILRRGARVVHVSSCEGHLTKIPSQELRDKFSNPDITESELESLIQDFVKHAKAGAHAEAGWPNSTYQVSKVGVSCLTRIQQRTIDAERGGEDIIVNSVHPGWVDTDMSGHSGPLTPEEGARSSVFAALIPPGATSPKGAYIWHDNQVVDWVKGPTPSAY